MGVIQFIMIKINLLSVFSIDCDRLASSNSYQTSLADHCSQVSSLVLTKKTWPCIKLSLT